MHIKRSLGAKTIIFPTPVFVVGTYDKDGNPNMMTAAWSGICCSEPPCVYVSLRKATYTYGNILERKAFTISIPSDRHLKEADYFGMASGRSERKLAKTGLTPVASDCVDAPYIKEFPFIVECVLFKSVELGLHTQFVGQVRDIKADEEVLTESSPDIEKIRPLIFNPANRTYYAIGKYAGKAFSDGKIFLK